MVQVVFYSFAVYNKCHLNRLWQRVNFLKLYLFISSWKYLDACSNPKGTLRYSYFPIGGVKVVWEKSLINGVCDGVPSMEIEC